MLRHSRRFMTGPLLNRSLRLFETYPPPAPCGTVVGDMQYGYEPWLVETFVDSSEYRGICYQAANWIWIGWVTRERPLPVAGAVPEAPRSGERPVESMVEGGDVGGSSRF